MKIKFTKVQLRILNEAMGSQIIVNGFGINIHAFISGTLTNINMNTLKSLEEKGAIVQAVSEDLGWKGQWLVSDEAKEYLEDNNV